MINIDKDYLITVDLKNTKVKSDKTIFFYNTDLNICNIFIKLICTDEDKTIPDDLIVEFAVLKPETDEFKPLDATLISKEDLLYQVDLTTDYFDIVGKYSCEIRVSGTIENESKCFTSEEFDYVVRPNITAKLNKKIKNDKNLPILEKLIKDVKEITDGINKNEIQMKRDENLVGDNKTIVGAINQLREDVNSGIGGGIIGNSIEPALMDMPRIYFSEGTLPTSKTATMMKFDYYSKTNEYHGWAQIKCQGNSSMAYPKKNFTIKLYKDKAKTDKLKIDFKGWGKQSKFVLKANWIDLTHARNVVSARIWADIVKSRADYSSLPELLRTSPNQGAVDGFPVTVYGNGYYQGRYTLNIPKDKWMSNMDDTLDTHCILCGENYGSGCFRALPAINGSDWTDELHDTVPATIKTSWTNVVKFVMNSSDSEFKANLNNYIDVNSLIDYSLYGLISTGLDAFGKNQLYMTYDATKWFSGMYDMDSTWGLWWNGQSFVSNSYSREEFEDYKNGSKQGNLLYIRLQKLFIPQLKARYTELRQTIFTYPYLVNKFEEFIQICPQDIVKEDYASTTANGAYTGIPSKTTNNIQQLRANIDARLTYVDSYINSLVEPTPCTAITLNNTTLSFTTASTQTLTVTLTPTDTTDKVIWSVAPAGICTVENGVVTPIKNGSCVITATCGTQTATCNVTVNLPNVAVTALNLDKDTITLGTVAETDDSEVNYLNGAIWKDRQYTKNGFKEDGTNKVTSITIPYSGVYKLSYNGSLNLTFLGLGKIDSTGKLTGFYPESATKDTILTVLEPNTLLGISFYPNSNTITNEVYNDFSLTRIKKFSEMTTNIEVNIDELGKPGWSKSTEFNVIEYCLNNTNVFTDVVAIKVGDLLYKYPANYIGTVLATSDNMMASIATQKSYLPTMYMSKYYMSVGLPVDTYGTTFEEFKTYMTNNNKKIIINPSEYVDTLKSTNSKFQDIVKATLTPATATNKKVTWTSDNENVELTPNGLNCTVKAKAIGNSVVTCTSQDTTNGTISDTCNVTVSDVPDTPPVSSSLIFKVDGTCLDTTNNTLTDKVGGVKATLKGTPSLANNNLAFDDNSSFYFDLTSLNIGTINGKTFRIKFKPTSLDTQLRNVLGIGQGSWANSFTGYITKGVLKVQTGSSDYKFTNATIGVNDTSTIDNAITPAPVINTEYEIVMSYKNDTSDIRIFMNGILIQNGNSKAHNYIKIFNNEGPLRFIGEYISIEVYSEFVDTYEEFTNLIK